MFRRIGQGFRRMGAEVVDHLSPTKLFDMEQARKLAREGGLGDMPGLSPRQAAKIDARRAFAENQYSMGQRVSHYFQGHNTEDLVGDAIMDGTTFVGRTQSAVEANSELYQRVANRRRNARIAAAGVLGTATVGSLVLGRGNAVTETGVAGATVGAVGMAAAGISEWGHVTGKPGLGGAGAAALVGWTAMNAYRRGDNWGPF